MTSLSLDTLAEVLARIYPNFSINQCCFYTPRGKDWGFWRGSGLYTDFGNFAGLEVKVENFNRRVMIQVKSSNGSVITTPITILAPKIGSGTYGEEIIVGNFTFDEDIRSDIPTAPAPGILVDYEIGPI